MLYNTSIGTKSFFKVHNDDKKELFSILNGHLPIVDEKSRPYSFAIRTNLTKETLPKLDEYIKIFVTNFGKDQRFSLLLRKVIDMGGDRIKNVGKKNVIVIDVNGNIHKCAVTSIDKEKASKSIIGTVENEGK